MNWITDDDAPCIIPEYVSKISEIFPKPFRIQRVLEYIDFRACNIIDPTPIFNEAFMSRNPWIDQKFQKI